jgi:serine/threonine protein phosphatase PrpC
MLIEKAAPAVQLDVRACSARGRRRYNADGAATYHDPGTGSHGFAVADGIGDTEAAAHAARLAADVAARAVSRPSATSAVSPTSTVNALLAARTAVCALTPDDPARRQGDAVLVVATLLPRHLGGGFSVAWAGDSRAYHWDGQSLTQLTVDQTVAEYFRRRGQPAAARMEHVVTNSVRLSTPLNIGHSGTEGIPGRLVLTTDGIHRNLDHDELARIVGTAGDSRTTAAALVLAALRRGGTDNATALVIDSRWRSPELPR